MNNRLWLFVFLATVGFLVVGCPPDDNCDANLKHLTTAHDSTANVFRQVIPDKPALAPNSAAIISRQLTRVGSNTEVRVSKGEWSYPVYHLNGSTYSTIYVVGSKGELPLSQNIGQIRWRACIVGGNSGDRHALVVDEVDGCITGFWMLNGFWYIDANHAASASGFPLWDVSAVAEPGEGHGNSAGNVSVYGSAVWPDEATNGFNHGFMFSCDTSVNNMDHFSLPFHHGDGDGTHSDDLFQGMQVQLNPSFPTDDLIYEQGGKTYTYRKHIADALITYGMYDGNSNVGNWGVYGVGGIGYSNNPWTNIHPDPAASSFSTGVPINQFRVLAPRWNMDRNYSANNSCITYYNTGLPAAPVISSMSPSSGSIAGGTVVTLTGSNFTGATKVRFNMSDATNLNVVSDSQIICTTPPEAGTAIVTVINSGCSNGYDFTYTGGGGAAPAISSLSPASGTNAGGTTVTINGSNLSYCMKVTFGGIPATNVIVDSSSRIRCTSPAVPSQTVSVQVRTPNGYSDDTIAACEYIYTGSSLLPTLTNISPSSGSTDGGTEVTLTGTNLAGCSTLAFHHDESRRRIVRVKDYVVDSNTQIRCTPPAFTPPIVEGHQTSGAMTVTVGTAHGVSNGVGYTYGDGPAQPTLSAINPTSGSTAGGTACTLTGANLTGCSSVSFSGTAASGIVVDSSTQVRCTSPTHAAGGVNVTATTPNGTSGAVAYTYVTPPSVPTLSAIQPTLGTTAGGTACTLTGTSLTGCSAVSFGGTAATGIVVDSSTQVRCTSPSGSAGDVSVTATTSYGTSNAVSYTYNDGGYTVTLYPSDDSYVLSSSSATNFGTTNLVVQENANTHFHSYIKFNLSTVQGSTVTSAILRIRLRGCANAHTIKVYSCATDSWTNSGIKWSNKPDPGSEQASIALTTTLDWYSADITSFVSGEFAGDKLVTVIMMDPALQNRNSQYYSLETGASNGYEPQLVVQSQ